MRTPWRALRESMTRTVYVSPPIYSLNVLGYSPEKLYETQPHLRTVIDFLARNMQQLPLKCYELGDDGSRERDRSSDVALLMRRPNESQTIAEFISELVSRDALYDIVYTVIAPDKESPSGWTWRIIPNDWVRNPKGSDPFNITKITVVTKNGGTVDIEDGLVIFHGWSPLDPRTGSSPVQSLKETLAEQISANQFRNQVWKNGGRFAEYITRPKDVEPWDENDVSRFRKQFANSWTGKGEDAGGVPVLEDGMEVKSVQFNAKEAQWLETAKLSLETCCWVYGVKPAMITGEGQTYASVKENARALYSDILGPKITYIQQRINEFVLPIMGAGPSKYVEFDLQAKLMGSFEEQAAILSTSTGAPWLTRSEARERMNLPRIDGADDLIVPLNVIEGGLASPRDTGSNSADIQRVMLLNSEKPETKSNPRKARGHPDDEDGKAIEECLRKFFMRQKSSVLAKLGAKADSDWWDSERWNSELAEDLYPLIFETATKSGKRGLSNIGISDGYDAGRTEAYLKKMAEGRAKGINAVTEKRIQMALDGDYEDEDAEMSDPSGVFDVAIEDRAHMSGFAIATCAAGWGLMEGIRQCANQSEVTKTWIHNPSGHPRSDHAAMDGETVAFDEPFSNGAMWPGDGGSGLDAADWANCHCEVEITRS